MLRGHVEQDLVVGVMFSSACTHLSPWVQLGVVVVRMLRGLNLDLVAQALLVQFLAAQKNDAQIH